MARMDPSDLAKRKNRSYSRNVHKSLWKGAKVRAKKHGLAFDLRIEDIVIPEVCPVLGIKIEVATGSWKHNSPSLDRFHQSEGYTKGNVWVISWRANCLKRDATLEELEVLVAGLRKEQERREPLR